MKIGDKTFMNLQEAVGWLLENNALPFQSTANYVGNTEIALSTIVNPSPAKVRVGSLIFFADSKVSTVVGLTSNSFIVSDQYNDLVDDIVYVSNVTQNASGHLIVTLSNGDNIDAGLIKQVVNFSINGSQHLIVNYNDGSTTDLGAIFSGNITIGGNLTVTGTINGYSTQDEYNGNLASIFTSQLTLIASYVKAVCNFREIIFIMNFRTKNETGSDIVIPNDNVMCSFSVPVAIRQKIYAHNGNNIDSVGSQGPIAYANLFVTKTNGTPDVTKYANLFHNGGGDLKFYLEGGNVTIQAGETRDFEARISLAL